MNYLRRNVILLVVSVVLLTGCITSRRERAAIPNPGSEVSFHSETLDAVSVEVAGPALGDEATLQDYIVYAGLNNPGLTAAFKRFKAAWEKIPQAESLPDPTFEYMYAFEMETSRFELTQMFPWFGKLALEGDMAYREAEAEYENFLSKKNDLIYEVKEAYFEYYYLGRSIEITEENLKLLQYLEGIARTRYENGLAEQESLIRIQVEIGTLDDQVRTLKDMGNPTVAKLNAILGRPSYASIPRPKTVPEGGIGKSDEELLKTLEENNPMIRSMSLMANMKKISIERAKKEYYPDIGFGLRLETAGSAMGSDESVMASVMINVPIRYAKYNAAVGEAEANREKAVNDLVELRNRSASELAMALYLYRDSERRIDLYKGTLIPKAEQSLKVTEESFVSGKSSSLDLVDAERALLEFQLSYERALVDYAVSTAKVEMLTADGIVRSEVEGTSETAGAPENEQEKKNNE